jgi:hypothetical protein
LNVLRISDGGVTLAGVGEGQDDMRVITLKRSMILFGVSACFLAMSAASFATDEFISYSQDSAGAITANLTGEIPFCDALLGGFNGPPANLVSEYAVTINSTIYQGECNPGGPPPPPTPYIQSMFIGNLPDGDYSVDWVFVMTTYLDGPPPWPPQDHYSSFAIVSGELVIFRNGFESQ